MTFKDGVCFLAYEMDISKHILVHAMAIKINIIYCMLNYDIVQSGVCVTCILSTPREEEQIIFK
jgi:hypothetical protein